MEVTTVSPSPASPTEGDDLCQIDVTNVAIHSVTLLICLCGLVGNGAVLRLLSLKLCYIDIFQLAFADFLFLLFIVPSALIFLVEDVSCSPIMFVPYLTLLSQLSVFSWYWALFWLMLRGKIVYMDKLCKICCHCDLSEHRLQLVFNVLYWALIALLTVIPAVTNLCPSHQQQHCWAALISMYAIILLLFAPPILISITIHFIRAMRCSNNQQPKTRDIVIILIVLFNFFLFLCHFLKQFGYTIVSSDVFFLLNSIQSSIKPFIYILAAAFRRPCSLRSLWLSLQRVFDEQNEETSHSNDVPMDTGV